MVHFFKKKNNTDIIFTLKPDFAQVIAEELYRNICLAFLCILITTLLLLFDVLGCIFVLMAVAHTITNVAGFMHFWGESSSELMPQTKHNTLYLVKDWLYDFF